jgi:hypothetical protein
MNGILEQILEELRMIRAAGGIAAQAAPAQPQYAPPQQPAYQAPPQQPAYQAPPQQPAPANITSDMITQLITPHVANPAIKEALGVEMRAMGINALPETQAHQYTELYQRFQGVLARFAAGGPAPAPAPRYVDHLGRPAIRS